MSKVVLFALLFVHCSCSKTKNDLRIPNVADLDISNGAVGNLGGVPSVGNIANVVQSNLNLGQLGNNGLWISPNSLGNIGMGNLGSSVGNVANIAQSNVDPSSVGNVANVVQSNVNTVGSGVSSGISNSGDSNNDTNNNNNNNNGQNGNGLQSSVGNIANVAQSNVEGTQGNVGSAVGNIANVGQSSVSGIQGPVNSVAQSGVSGIQGPVNSIGSIGQSGISGIQGPVNSIAQSGVSGVQGPVNSIAQSGVSGVQGPVNSIGNVVNMGQSSISGLQGPINSIGSIANMGQGNLGGLMNLGQNNLGAMLNYLANNGQNYYPYGKGYSNNYLNNNNFPNNNNFNNNNYFNNNNNNINNNNNNNNNVEERNIERPCQVFDTYCIRKYFAENSKCKESHGPVPDPIYRVQSTMYLPNINLTVTSNDVLYGGLNGRIEEFYINKETDKLVMSIEFRNLTFYSRDTYLRFHRRAREPIVNVDYLYLNYRSLVSTIVIPNRKDLQLQKSESTSILIESPLFSVGPKGFDSPDEVVQTSRILLIADPSRSAQEATLTESAYYTSTFIQYSLCDFGLKVL